MNIQNEGEMGKVESLIEILVTPINQHIQSRVAEI